MEEDKGNGVIIPQVEDASKSQQERLGDPQVPESLLDLPEGPEAVLGAEDLVPQPQHDKPPKEVDVPQLAADNLTSCTSQTP